MDDEKKGGKSQKSSVSTDSSPHTPLRDLNSNTTLRPSPFPRQGSTYGSLLGTQNGQSRPASLVNSHGPIGSKRHESSSTIASHSSSDTKVELGRLQVRLEHKEERVNELIVALDVEKDALAEARQEVQALQNRVADLNFENDRLSTAQASSTATIASLRDSLEKANKTIQIQSNQIRNPRDGRKYGPDPSNSAQTPLLITNGEPGHSLPARPTVEVIPYRNRAHDSPRTPTFGRFPPQDASTLGRADSRPRHPYGEGRSAERPGFIAQQINEYAKSQYRQPRSQAQSFETVIHQDRRPSTAPPPNIGAMLSRLFNMVIEWCKTFCNDPSSGARHAVPREIWADLGQQTNNEVVRGLLADPQTRYLVISKVVLGRLVSFALYKKLIRHFKTEYDERILAAARDVRNDMPADIRQERLMATNKIALDISKDIDWEASIGYKVQGEVNALWHIVNPLLDHSSSPNEAWTGLCHIFDQGVKAGLQMQQTLATFSIDFPPVGPDSMFNKEAMANVDPYFRHDPNTLGKMGLRVRLAVSPLIVQKSFEDITVRNNPRVILSAKVLLMQGNALIGTGGVN